jgi:hypothetical protein
MIFFCWTKEEEKNGENNSVISFCVLKQLFPFIFAKNHLLIFFRRSFVYVICYFRPSKIILFQAIV